MATADQRAAFLIYFHNLMTPDDSLTGNTECTGKGKGKGTGEALAGYIAFTRSGYGRRL